MTSDEKIKNLVKLNSDKLSRFTQLCNIHRLTHLDGYPWDEYFSLRTNLYLIFGQYASADTVFNILNLGGECES